MHDSLPETIPDALARAAEQFGGIEALVDERERLTYAGLRDAAGVAARALVAAGVEPGDRVGMWAPNTTEWVVAALGIYRAGGVIVPLNTRFKGNEAAFILDDAQVKLLFTTTDFLDTDYVAMLRDADAPSLPGTIVVLRGATARRHDELGRLPRGGRWRDARNDRSTRERALTGDDLSDIMFTSGTTGRPKGAMLTHGASVRAYDAWSNVVGLQAGDRYLIANPFFHTFGLKAGILASIVSGSTIVPHAVFDVDAIMQRVVDEQITMLPGAPTVYQSILDHPRVSEFDMSTLRLGVTGAATVPVELIRRIREELGFDTMVTGYGLTEATGIATMCRHDDDAETIATRCGRAIPDVEVAVVDENGKEVPYGEPGEVVVRGYNIMKGFLEQPGGHRRGDRRRRLVAHRRHRCDGRARLPPYHRPHEGHVHRRWLQRVSRRDREHDARASRARRR